MMDGTIGSQSKSIVFLLRYLIQQIRDAIDNNENYKEKLNNYLYDNDLRIIEELDYDQALDILSIFDSNLYLSIKNNIENVKINSEISITINTINDFIDSNNDNYICINKIIHDEYNAIFLISKKVYVTIIEVNTNNPFHNYECKKDKMCWCNFIIKCQSDKKLNLIENDKIFKAMFDNECPVFTTSTPHHALSILEKFR